MTSTVLIVDDDPGSRASIDAILEGQGYRLEMAENGKEALEKAGKLRPDLILLDVMMPGMDGFEVCRQMRATSRLAEVPIVFLTAMDDRSYLLKAIDAGADDFLTKPVDRAELNARVRTITRLNRYHTLLEQRQNLSLMAGRVVAAQEDERLRLSRELHDDLGQALTAHQLGLRRLADDMPEKMEVAHQQIDELISGTNEILSRIRQLAQDLRPPLLEALGLQGAISAHCMEFSRRASIPIQVEIEPDLPEIPDHLAVTLYRILQEALTNVTKHAKARKVWVDLTRGSWHHAIHSG